MGSKFCQRGSLTVGVKLRKQCHMIWKEWMTSFYFKRNHQKWISILGDCFPLCSPLKMIIIHWEACCMLMTATIRTCIGNDRKTSSIQHIHTWSAWNDGYIASMLSKHGMMSNLNVIFFGTSWEAAECFELFLHTVQLHIARLLNVHRIFAIKLSTCVNHFNSTSRNLFSYVLFWGIFSSPKAAHNNTAPTQGTDMAFPAMRTWAVRHVRPSCTMGVQLSFACCFVTGRTWEDNASCGSRKRPWA